MSEENPLNLFVSPAFLLGDAREKLCDIKTTTIKTVVTSPPYWGLRSYDGIGGEDTPSRYIDNLIAVMKEVERVLTTDGTAWVNLGDTYAGYHGSSKTETPKSTTNGWAGNTNENKRQSCSAYGERANNLLLLPFKFAERVKQETGLFLRSNIAWCKPAGKPEKHALKRPWRSTEYIFQFTKSKSHNCFAPFVPRDHVQYDVSRDRTGHPAQMPLKMATDLILSSTNPGDTVLDPFMGAGTTGIAAAATGRGFIGIEIDPDYLGMARARLAD